MVLSVLEGDLSIAAGKRKKHDAGQKADRIAQVIVLIKNDGKTGGCEWSVEEL